MEKTYHSYVQSLSSRWRRLEHLNSFMNENSTRRFHQPRIAVLDFDDHNGLEPRVINLPGLSAILDQSSTFKGGRLFLVEDLSNEVVELLGSRLDIEPEFFASHIYSLDWFSRASSPTTVPNIYSTICAQSFVRFRYLEARSVLVKANQEINIDRLPCTNSNLLRKVSIMKLESTNGMVGLARRHVTIWVKPGANTSNWTGVVLLDPGVQLPSSTGLQWLTSACPEFVPSPLFSEMSLGKEAVSRPSDSTFDTILFYYQNHWDLFAGSAGCFNAVAVILRSITAEWTNVSHIIESELNALVFAHESEPKRSFSSFDRELSQLYSWRRRCIKYHEILEETSQICKSTGLSNWTKASDGGDEIKQRVGDIGSLCKSFQRLSLQAEQQLTVLLGRISVEAGKEAVREAARVTRLTTVALVFLPMSCMASIFSMSGRFAIDAQLGWVYFAAAVPLSLIVLLGGLYHQKADPWSPPRRVDEWDSKSLISKGLSY